MCTLSWATASFDGCDHPFQSVTKVEGFVSSIAEIGTFVVVPGAARRAASAWIIWSWRCGPMCAPSWRLAELGQVAPCGMVVPQ